MGFMGLFENLVVAPDGAPQWYLRKKTKNGYFSGTKFAEPEMRIAINHKKKK